MRRLQVIIWVGFLLLSITPVLAAVLGADCPALVQQALASTHQLCQDTGRNQACYGNLRLSAEPQPGVTRFTFETPGDMINVADIRTLRLMALEEASDIWGVALMRPVRTQTRIKARATINVGFGDEKYLVPCQVDLSVIQADSIHQTLPSYNTQPGWDS
jgi:hypothetical protein